MKAKTINRKTSVGKSKNSESSMRNGRPGSAYRLCVLRTRPVESIRGEDGVTVTLSAMRVPVKRLGRRIVDTTVQNSSIYTLNRMVSSETQNSSMNSLTGYASSVRGIVGLARQACRILTESLERRENRIESIERFVMEFIGRKGETFPDALSGFASKCLSM